ncbi:unnamed protein product [Diamesa serratosioi]
MVISAPTIIVTYNQEKNMELADKLILNELESIKTSKTLLIDFIYSAITSILTPNKSVPPPFPPQSAATTEPNISGPTTSTPPPPIQ